MYVTSLYGTAARMYTVIKTKVIKELNQEKDTDSGSNTFSCILNVNASMCSMTFYVLQIYTKNMIIRRHYLKLAVPGNTWTDTAGCIASYLLYSLILYRGIEIVQYCIERDSRCFDGFEAEQCVVDTAQLAGSYEYQRILFFCNVVYRQVILGKGNH